MKTLISILFLAFAVLIGCHKDAVTVDISKICSPDNEKKYISTTGFLTDRGSIYCSNAGGRLDCGLDAATSPDGERMFSAEIEEGNGADQIAKLESGYKASDIKIFDNGGTPIKLSDKVKLTGEMNVGGGACFLEVDKIEKP